MRDTIYNVWITLVDNVGPRTATALVDSFGDAINVFKASFEDLVVAGASRTVAENIVNNRESLFWEAERIVELCEKSNIRILTKGDVNYPHLLANTSDAPMVLYVRGNTNFNYGNFLSIVGTRGATLCGMNLCRKLVFDMKENLVSPIVVSGLARGIDKCAHNAALDYGIPTVAVMPGWVDDITPAEHYQLARQIIEKGGAIVSDMPPKTIITKTNFLSRNRIIAGLSLGTVVVESKLKGGSMATADLAFGYNREVFAFVGDGGDTFAGTANLIKSSKALLLQQFSDISNTLNWEIKQAKAGDILDNVDQRLISLFSALPDGEQFCVEQAAEIIGVTILECSRILTRLEILGLISSLHGRLYVKN